MRSIKISIYSLFFLLLASCVSTKNTSTVSTKKNQSTQQGEAIVKTAESYIGTKYKLGGLDKKGLDCSGLVYVVYQEYGITLPRTSEAQSHLGKAVYIGELQAGDLIFFASKDGHKKISHAGIVSFSDGKTVKFIHASTSKGVREDDVEGYWRPKYVKARRVL